MGNDNGQWQPPDDQWAENSWNYDVPLERLTFIPTTISEPGPSQHGGYGSALSPEQDPSLLQKGASHSKRTRESSRSSSGRHHQGRPKHLHQSEWYSREIQGPSVTQSPVPQSTLQAQQPLVQNIGSRAEMPGMGAVTGGNLPPPQRGSVPYDHRHPYVPNFKPYEPNLNLIRPLDQIEPRSYPSGVGRGHAPQTQGKSSSQGAGQFQLDPPQATGADYGPSHWAHRREPEPVRRNVLWTGNTFALDNTMAGPNWSREHDFELAVIMASFGSWLEVAQLGQSLPGERSERACIDRWRKCGQNWTLAEDASLRRLQGSQRTLGVEAWTQEWHNLVRDFARSWPDRSRAELEGRLRLFIRHEDRENLGNVPARGVGGRVPRPYRPPPDR